MFFRATIYCLTLVSLGLLSLTGCNRGEAQSPTANRPKPVDVVIALPVVQVVTPREEFPGHLEAEKSVMLQAEVSGQLEKVHFKDGQIVEEKQLLYEIDPRTYQAEADRTAGAVAQAQAKYDRLTRTYQRAQSLLNSRTISQEEYDTVAFDRAESEAVLNSAKAAKEAADVNLSRTKIHARLTGKISSNPVDEGNLIRANETKLATIRSVNPIRALFDVDERTELKLRRLMQAGKLGQKRVGEVEVQMSLADEDDYQRTGKLDFVDNQIESNTGTQRLRALVPNEDGLLSHGMFVRIRMAVGEPKECVLIPEEALGSDQGIRFVFVVNAQNKVVYRRVTTGVAVGSLRVVEGITPTERVIVAGLQKVKDGVEVNPKTAAEKEAENKKKSADATAGKEAATPPEKTPDKAATTPAKAPDKKP